MPIETKARLNKLPGMLCPHSSPEKCIFYILKLCKTTQSEREKLVKACYWSLRPFFDKEHPLPKYVFDTCQRHFNLLKIMQFVMLTTTPQATVTIQFGILSYLDHSAFGICASKKCVHVPYDGIPISLAPVTQSHRYDVEIFSKMLSCNRHKK